MHPSAVFPEQFARHVVVHPISGCWLWTGHCDRGGYGKVRHGSQMKLAHRRAYEISRQTELGPRQVVCHRCDTPGCVRPDHLEAGTQAENLRQAITRGRRLYAFTAREVWMLRSLHFHHGVPLLAIYAMVNHERTTVRDAVEGRTYRHVPHPRDHPSGFTPVFSSDGRRVMPMDQADPHNLEGGALSSERESLLAKEPLQEPSKS